MENIPVCNLNFALHVAASAMPCQCAEHKHGDRQAEQGQGKQLLQLQSPRLWPGILKQAACKINSTRQKAAQCRLQEELLHTLA